MVVAVHLGGNFCFRDLADTASASFKATNFVPAWYVAWYGSWRTFVVDGESRCGQLGYKQFLGILHVVCIQQQGLTFLVKVHHLTAEAKINLLIASWCCYTVNASCLRILEGPVGWGDLLMYENYLVISNRTWTFKDISQVNGLDQSIDIEVAFCCNEHGCTWGKYIQLHRDTTVGSLTLVPNLRNGVVSFDDSPLVSWWKVLGVCLEEGWGRPRSISPEFVSAQFCVQECWK